METLQRTANRGSISTAEYEIDNSCKFESDNTEYLSKTPSSAGNRKTWTFSAWVKRSAITATSNATGNQNMVFSAGDTYLQFDGNAIWINHRAASENFFLATTRLFRDSSAWYHIVWQLDTTDSTAADRAKLYINGVRETSFQNNTYNNMSQNYDAAVNNTVEHEIGKYSLHDTTYAGMFNGYMAEIHLVDGTALTPTSFGEFDTDSGIWKPKAYAGSHGTNGFYLDFEDASNMGNDASGGTDFAETNISAADQSTDTPTNNFCTWNPLWDYASKPTITEGATKVRIDDSTNEGAKGTIGLTNGKWYWEAKPFYTLGAQQIGIQTDGDSNIYANANSTANNYGMWINPIGNYYTYSDGQTESSDQGWDLTASDWLGIALDMDSSTQTIKYYKNGSLIQSLDLISNMQGRTVFPFLMNYENRSWDINFGGYTINTISSAETDANGYGTFEYAPPSGHYSICTKNLAEFGG